MPKETTRVITTNPHGPSSQSQKGEQSQQAQQTGQNQNTQEARQQGTQDSSQQQAQASQEQRSSDAGDAVAQASQGFRHPRLTGRTPEEVDRMYSMAEETVRSQGQRLSSLEREVKELRSQSTTQAPPQKLTSQDFFAEPHVHIEQMLDKAIKPLREEIQEAKEMATAPNVRSSMRSRFADWDQVEPYVDMLLEQNDFPNRNDPALLQTLYYTAKGVMAEQGINIGQAQQQTQQGQQDQQSAQAGYAPANTVPAGGGRVMAPPQHRASTPPPPPRPASGNEGPHRQLTELEKRMAREYGMTDEEYLTWQEMDERDVPYSKYGLEEGNNNG